MSAEETSTRFRVEGMDCASCASKIDTAVRRLPGVAEVSVSVVAGTMTVGHRGADLDQVQQKVSDLGYRIAPLTGAAPKAAAAGDGRSGPWALGGRHAAACRQP